MDSSWTPKVDEKRSTAPLAEIPVEAEVGTAPHLVFARMSRNVRQVNAHAYVSEMQISGVVHETGGTHFDSLNSLGVIYKLHCSKLDIQCEIVHRDILSIEKNTPQALFSNVFCIHSYDFVSPLC